MFSEDTKTLATNLIGNYWATDHHTPSWQTYPESGQARAALLTAAEWTGNDFTSDEAREWMDAGAFDADSAVALRDAGLTPLQARVVKVASDGHIDDPTMSIAYAHSNCDLTTADAVVLAA